MGYSDYNKNGASNISIKPDRVFADLDLSYIPHPAFFKYMSRKITYNIFN